MRRSVLVPSTVLFRNFAERGHTTVKVNINQAEGLEKRQLYTGYIHFMIFVTCSFDAVSAQIYHAGIPQCTNTISKLASCMHNSLLKQYVYS